MLNTTPTTATRPMAAKEKTFYAALGQRIAEQRKARNITQVELAATLGIAQQTMAHYEGGVSRIAVETLTELANALSIQVEDLIGSPIKRANNKRGPASKLELQLQQVSQLPRAKQKLVSEVLDSLLSQAAR